MRDNMISVLTKSQGESVAMGNVVIDLKSLSVYIDGNVVHLTRQEFKVLLYLFHNKNCAVSREQLLRDIWKITDPLETRATDDTIKRIRKKLIQNDASINIETIRSFGFIVRDIER